MVGLLCSVVIVLLAAAAGAEAGDYHVGPTLVCEECHLSPGAGVAASPLRGSSADAVCLSCHDNRPGLPDVQGDDVNGGAAPRQSGGLSTGVPPYEDWKGHRLGNTEAPPGGSWPAGETRLSCISCHSPHGNGNYRNLGGKVPNVSISYVTSPIPTNAADVRIDLPAVPPVGQRVAAGFYSATRIYFNTARGDAPYGRFCAGCHTQFHGITNTGAASPFRRHPTERVRLSAGDAARYRTNRNRVPVMFEGNGARVTYDTGASVSCMSCHKAHGNRNAFGLIFMRATGPVTEQGVEGGNIRDLCDQCHTQGG